MYMYKIWTNLKVSVHPQTCEPTHPHFLSHSSDLKLKFFHCSLTLCLNFPQTMTLNSLWYLNTTTRIIVILHIFDKIIETNTLSVLMTIIHKLRALVGGSTKVMEHRAKHGCHWRLADYKKHFVCFSHVSVFLDVCRRWWVWLVYHSLPTSRVCEHTSGTHRPTSTYQDTTTPGISKAKVLICLISIILLGGMAGLRVGEREGGDGEYCMHGSYVWCPIRATSVKCLQGSIVPWSRVPY